MAYSLTIPPEMVRELYFIRQKTEVSIRKQIIESIKKHIKDEKEVLSMESYKIDESMLEKIRALGLPEKKENNEYILLHIHGDNVRAPKTFNAKVYSGKKGLKLVTNDYGTLMELINCKQKNSNYSRTIFVDDSGFGMPIGGTLVGVYDTETNEVYIEEVLVEFYQPPLFEQQKYLEEAANKAIKILDKLNIDKSKTLIKVCTGFVNVKIKNKLREFGFDVEIAEIGEPLQSELERRHKQYIKSKFGYTDYYDPKEVDNVASEFNKVIKWIKEKPEERLKFAKTGWDFFKTNFTQNENFLQIQEKK